MTDKGIHSASDGDALEPQSEPIEQTANAPFTSVTVAELEVTAPELRAARICMNCEEPLTGKFCSNCSQRSQTRTMDWKWLVHEVQYGIIQMDRGFFFTLKELFTRPGPAIRDYLEGKRKRYFSPFTMLMILGALNVLLANWVGVAEHTVHRKSQGPDPDMVEYMEWVINYQTYLMLALLPFVAWGTSVFMSKFGHGFVEHVMINAFILVQITAFGLITTPLDTLEGKVPDWFFDLMICITVGLIFWTFLGLYRDQAKWKILVTGIAGFAFALFIFLIVFFCGTYITYALGLELPFFHAG